MILKKYNSQKFIESDSKVDKALFATWYAVRNMALPIDDVKRIISKDTRSDDFETAFLRALQRIASQNDEMYAEIQSEKKAGLRNYRDATLQDIFYNDKEKYSKYFNGGM